MRPRVVQWHLRERGPGLVLGVERPEVIIAGQHREFVCVRGRQHAADRHGTRLLITEERVAVGEGMTERGDHEMPAFGIVSTETGEVETLEDGERLQHGPPTRGRRRGGHTPAPI